MVIDEINNMKAICEDVYVVVYILYVSLFKPFSV